MTGRDKAIKIAGLALDKKASDVVVLELEGLVTFTDYFVICSGGSDTQVRAITEHILRSLSAERKSRRAPAKSRGAEPISRRMEPFPRGVEPPRAVEGERACRWVLMDFGDVIVHVFEEETRRYYELEKLWLDAPRIPVPDAKEKSTGKKAAVS